MKVSKEYVTHPNQSFRLIELELGAFRGERHRHRQLELTWIEQGAGLRFVGDSVQPFDAGDLVLLGPQLPHAWVSAAERVGQRHASTVLQFGPELILQSGLPELGELAELMAMAGRGLRVEGPAFDAVVPVLRRMSGLSPVRRVAALLEVLGLLLQHQADLKPIASALQRAAEAGQQGEDRRRVDRVIEWIHQHMQDTLTVEAAAGLVHVSPASFSRFFSREVGKSFTAYVNDVRCSEASLRLSLSDRPVAVIARECGFETISHFNRQFRLRHGVSPRELRRQQPVPRSE